MAGTVPPPGASQQAHQRSATRFHLDSPVSRLFRRASARSLARTSSSVSFGPDSSEKRTGSAASRAVLTVSGSKSDSVESSRRAAAGRLPGGVASIATHVPSRLSPA